MRPGCVVVGAPEPLPSGRLPVAFPFFEVLIPFVYQASGNCRPAQLAP